MNVDYINVLETFRVFRIFEQFRFKINRYCISWSSKIRRVNFINLCSGIIYQEWTYSADQVFRITSKKFFLLYYGVSRSILPLCRSIFDSELDQLVKNGQYRGRCSTLNPVLTKIITLWILALSRMINGLKINSEL